MQSHGRHLQNQVVVMRMAQLVQAVLMPVGMVRALARQALQQAWAQELALNTQVLVQVALVRAQEYQMIVLASQQEARRQIAQLVQVQRQVQG